MSTQNARRLSAGMVGGGIGADIGKTHRFGMRMDDRYSLDAGVFGRDVEEAAGVASSLGVAAERTYASYQEMAAAEAARQDGIDVAIVATPNDSHFEVAKAFLERGISVVCEKPLTRSSSTARQLVDLAERHDAILAVPHCYSAYPMVREAARMVSDGRLGRLTFVDVEHASGWAATPLELTGHKQASWRTDPDVAGFPSVVGDLGTHGYHLARYITGLEADRVSAQLHTLVPGRKVFDNATVALEFSEGVPGRLWASMAATGHNHGLRIRVFGDEGSLDWQHEDPHHLTFQDLEGTTTIFTHGLSSLSEDSARLTRVGLGHPEGFLEAFGNFYRDLADELEARRDARASTIRELSFPTGIDGLIGVQFVEAVAASHAADSAWTVPGSVADRDAEIAAADAELREVGGN
ncbi:Gfo/Idh/MocA family protein [Pseudoclavibacter terrae]|uniref:Gfo/Idh/MocA family protein n=1 Tax=Pseudoclavibacter terrae TaxID=1530195 RepID=UPI00232B26D4|nr:Gfo/Idh/MocA family oxidoreductase [Pseudoclavibacter terrae]